VGDHVDAFLGQIMVEAANAVSTINAGLVYRVVVAEAASATDAAFASRQMSAAVAETVAAGSAQDATLVAGGVVSAAVVEAATAADAPDASVIAGVRFEGVLALDGPIMPSTPQPTVIYIEG
jgi:hypothetical protein